MAETKFIPLAQFRQYPVYAEVEMQQRAAAFYAQMRQRRSVRHFSQRSVPRDVIEHCILAAGTAPSGANKQPWHFVAVSNPEVKRRIREAAEAEERAFYGGRAPEEWLNALQPFQTTWQKPFLEHAPYLIAIFAQSFNLSEEGEKIRHYYVQESVGIATGILITAVHQAGLACLTHTPSPMNFLNEILVRPKWERPYLLLVVGYPAEDTQVPDIDKKSLAEMATFV